MTDAAAFSATFADWKLIKTRGCVQIVLEVPLHQADHAYQVLGGMPDPSKERWVGVARLAGATREREAEGATVPPAPASSASRSWNELSAAQQAGIRCGERAFQRYLAEVFPNRWARVRTANAGNDALAAAHLVRELCKVESRSQIDSIADAKDSWRALDNDFFAWHRYPEVVG